MYNTTKHPDSNRFIVAKGDQSFKTSGSLFPASGNSLSLADGQLGVVSWDKDGLVEKGSFLSATNGPGGTDPNTAASVKSIKIVQGTPWSNSIANLDWADNSIEKPAFVQSVEIKSSNPIKFVGKAAATPLLDAHVIGAAAGTAGSFITTDFTPQALRVAFESVRSNKWLGIHNQDYVYSRTPSVDYAALSLTTDAAKTDYVVQHLAYGINSRSYLTRYANDEVSGDKHIIALGIDLDGGSGTALNTVVAGTPFNFMTRNGVTYSYTPDASFVATITEAIANSDLLATSTIEVIDLSTAGAGTNDVVMLVALPEQEARVMDTEPSLVNRIHVTGDEEMTSVNRTIASRATEGEGQGRFYELKYRFRANLQNYNRQWVGLNTTMLDKYNFVDPTQEYNVFLIESEDYRRDGVTPLEQFPARTYILVPSTDGASAANTLTDLNAILAPWLNSVSDFQADTPATAPSLFV